MIETPDFEFNRDKPAVSWIINVWCPDGKRVKKLVWNKEGYNKLEEEYIGHDTDAYLLQSSAMVYDVWAQAKDKDYNRQASKKAGCPVYGNIILAAKEFIREIE